MKRTATKLFSLALLLALLASPALAAATYGGGTGTKDDPFLISAKEHLAALRDAVNAGNAYAGTYFKLTRDIDLGEELWTLPIGKDGATPFSGHLDGDGHEIAGLKVAVSSSNDAYAGLFGVVDGGGTISNCSLTGTVEATLPDGTKLRSETLYVVTGRGTLSAPDLTVSPESANEGETVTFDLGDWLNKRMAVTPEGVVWTLNGTDVTDLVANGVLTVETSDGGDGTMTLIVTARLANGLEGTETVKVTVPPAPVPGPDPDPEPEPEPSPKSKSSGGCDGLGLGGAALLIAGVLLVLRRR